MLWREAERSEWEDERDWEGLSTMLLLIDSITSNGTLLIAIPKEFKITIVFIFKFLIWQIIKSSQIKF